MTFPKKLADSLLKVQGELRGVVKDSRNPHFKSSYASLENVIDTIRGPLTRHGIVFMQSPGEVAESGVLPVKTTLIHAESGEIYESTIGVPLVKRDPQGVGSAITYSCRYSLMALLGLPPVDDDGQSASLPKEQTRNPAASLDLLNRLRSQMKEQKTKQDLKMWMNDAILDISSLPIEMQDDLRTECSDALIGMK